MNIYQIDEAIMMAYESAIDMETGEVLDEEALTRLDELEMEREKKIEGVALWWKNIKAEAEAIKTEKMALAKRQSALENKAKSLEKYIASVTEGTKFSTPKVAIGWRKSEAVEVDADAFLPDEFLTFKAPEPNKTAIKKALKAGTSIEGARLIENLNLQIK